MNVEAHSGDEVVRREIARAFDELRPSMIANAHDDADLDPASMIDEFTESELEQFVNAYEALFMEALEGGEHSTRAFILETALPPILEQGQTALTMIRSNVISAVMMTYRLLPLIDAGVRPVAARWLASFHSGYTHDLAARALELEAKRS